MTSTTITPQDSKQCVGYAVRRTFFDGREGVYEMAFLMTDAFLEGRASWTTTYTDALEVARAVRREQGHWGYAVVDYLYADGTVGRG